MMEVTLDLKSKTLWKDLNRPATLCFVYMLQMYTNTRDLCQKYVEQLVCGLLLFGCLLLLVP